MPLVWEAVELVTRRDASIPAEEFITSKEAAILIISMQNLQVWFKPVLASSTQKAGRTNPRPFYFFKRKRIRFPANLYVN